MLDATNVHDSERITRYVFDSSQFSSNGVKWKAFQPDNGEVSIMRTEGLDEKAVWHLGFNIVGKIRNKNPKCRADFATNVVRSLGLEVVPKQDIHERHGNIVNWPEKEDEQLLLAKKLADKVNKEGSKTNAPS